MDANEITFGVEIETTMPATYAPHVGAYHGHTSAHGLPAGWLAMRDGSIRGSRDRVGCEFVSPVLQGSAGVRSVLAAVAAIKSMGGRVNASTGVHVHVGFDRRQTKELDRLTTLVANFEKAIYASTGTKSRERGSWSRGVQQLGNARTARNYNDRYRILNLTNLLAGRKPTVEFRAFAGTLNADKILGHVRMCVALVERALKTGRTTNWTAKSVKPSSPIHRNGEGQTALTRLFYQLGWTKGRQSHTFGDLHCVGAPTIQQTKLTLMKLARKYDGQP
jgi:hypothetical protein